MCVGQVPCPSQARRQDRDRVGCGGRRASLTRLSTRQRQGCLRSHRDSYEPVIVYVSCRRCSVHRDVQGPERGVGAMATTDVKPTDPGEIVHRPGRDGFDLAPLRWLELLQN